MQTTLLTVKEVAGVLRVPIPRAYGLARNGIIPVVRIGRQIRIDPEQLSDFISNGGRALAGGWRRENQTAV
jgi:putative molybdopterin biosynthesis protein